MLKQIITRKLKPNLKQRRTPKQKAIEAKVKTEAKAGVKVKDAAKANAEAKN